MTERKEGGKIRRENARKEGRWEGKTQGNMGGGKGRLKERGKVLVEGRREGDAGRK